MNLETVNQIVATPAVGCSVLLSIVFAFVEGIAVGFFIAAILARAD